MSQIFRPYAHIELSDTTRSVNDALREISNNLQQLVDVLPPAHGGLSQESQVALPVTGTPQKMPFNAAAPSRNVGVDVANDELTVTVTGNYLLQFSVNAAVSQNILMTFEVYVDGVPSGRDYLLEVIQQADAANAAPSAITTFNAGQVVSIYVSGTPDRTVTFDNMNFLVTRL